MSMTVPEPILAAPVEELPAAGSWSFEPKWDGFRALIARDRTGVRLTSRRGTLLTRAFGDIAQAAERDLPPGLLLDGELVIWHEGRLSFELLQRRLNRTSSAAAKEAAVHPANFVVFDVLHEPGRDVTALPYRERRALLEDLFADRALGPPWVLCPATTDRAEAEGWMRDWGPAGIEGLVLKSPTQRYRPGQRGWQKFRSRDSTEAVIGAVAGTLRAPTTVLFGRYDETGELRFVGRSTAVDSRMRALLAERLTPAAADHPWHGHTFAPAWGARDRQPMLPVAPDLVAEIAVDTAFDRGRWRHPVRLLRLRDDVDPTDLPAFGQGLRPASG